MAASENENVVESGRIEIFVIVTVWLHASPRPSILFSISSFGPWVDLLPNQAEEYSTPIGALQSSYTDITGNYWRCIVLYKTLATNLAEQKCI